MTTRRPRLWVAGKKHARFVASRYDDSGAWITAV